MNRPTKLLAALSLMGIGLAIHPVTAQGQADAPPFQGGALAQQGDQPAEGEIEGAVVNGTTGAPGAGLDVLLTDTTQESGATERIATTDEAGLFRFTGLADSNVAYAVSIVHEQIRYRTRSFRLADIQGRMELRIYDATDQAPGLRSDLVLLMLGSVDPRRQEIAAEEMVTLVNPSTQTYLPNPDGGPMGLVRFSLPPGASGLTPTLGLHAEEMVQVDRGFASLAAVPPGTRQYGFAYRFPYETASKSISLALPYGANAVRIFAPVGGPVIGGPGLLPADDADIEGQRYHVWGVNGVSPDGRLNLELRNLPVRPLWRQALDGLPVPGTWAAAALFAGVLVLGVGWSLRSATGGRGATGGRRLAGRRRAGKAGATAGAAAEPATREQLAASMADLDNAFEAGDLPEASYREQRAALLERLVARVTTTSSGAARAGTRGTA